MASIGVPTELRSRTLHHTGDLRQLVNTTYSGPYDFMDQRLSALELWERRLWRSSRGVRQPGNAGKLWRRTVGTNLARPGISKDIRARLLNHVEGARSVTDAAAMRTTRGLARPSRTESARSKASHAGLL